MRRLRIILALAFSGSFLSAQNLVPNNGFEANSGVPTGPGQYIRCSDWNNVNLWPTFQYPYASPDYLHASGSGGAQLPNSVFGVCPPFSGSAVMGAISWSSSAANFREYFACQLTSPMNTGQSYDIVVTVRNASGGYGGWGSNGIQVAFSTAPLFQATHEPIAVTPQLSVGSIFFNTNWQQLTFSLTPTQPYQYMTVGNFQNDASTLRSFSGSGGAASYFFYDAMSVTPAAVLEDNSLHLSGKSQDDRNLLNWAHEGDDTDWEVFRSRDELQYMLIGEVKKGKAMSFVDESPYYGVNTYKVRKRNQNGSVSWSNVLSILNEEGSGMNLVSVYPNPAAYELNIQLEHPKLDAVTATLYDMTGRKVLSRTFDVARARSSTLVLPVTELSEGIYSLQVRAGTAVVSRQVVVAR